MANLPNKYSHQLYYENYKRFIAAQKNPDGPEAKEIQAQSMAAAFAGQL